MPELTVRQARDLLADWTRDNATVASRRAQVIRTAYDSGLSKSEISRVTGIARSTIDRILGPEPDGSVTASEGKPGQ